MNIYVFLFYFRRLVEQHVGNKLKGFEFWLQGSQELDQNNSLQDQCLSCDTGLVQINLQIQWEITRINVLDVLKPTEEEIVKWNQKRTISPLEDSVDNKSPKFTFKSEDFDKEENSSKRNQKPSKKKLC